MPTLNQTLAATVRRLRLAKGLSQEALAELADLDRTYVSGIERCRRNATLLTIEKLIPVLADSSAQFLGELIWTLEHAEVHSQSEG